MSAHGLAQFGWLEPGWAAQFVADLAYNHRCLRPGALVSARAWTELIGYDGDCFVVH
ncbi:Uncharacterised protein [Mycobacteroides abscessus subsp. abscessus]|nr:Uncharacterised protein [Mycobacteroides abscessus subsp. abscessus]